MQRSILYSYTFLTGIIFFMSACKTVQQENKNEPDQYFTVSLYSPGNGIDMEARNIVLNTVKKYKDKGYEIPYTSVSWGKEGEVDYCFTLQNLKPEVYREFFNELSTLLKDRMVHIKEKVPCRSNY